MGFLQWLRGFSCDSETPVNHAGGETSRPCRHEDWYVGSHNMMGYGSCLDCQKEICLSELFNALHDKMERLLRRMEDWRRFS